MPALSLFLAPALPKAFVLAAALTCAGAPAPSVDIQFQNTPPVYDLSKSTAELGGFSPDIIVSHGPKELFVTGGITRSNIGTDYSANFRIRTDGQTGKDCVWVDQIHLRISYAPTVYIANLYPPGSCRYTTTFQHELRHVNTDVLTIQEYMPFFKKNMEAYAATLQPKGPFDAGDLKEKEGEYTGGMRDVMGGFMKAFQAARLQRQSLIDTRQEYLRLTHACPDEPPPVPGG